MRLDVPHEVPRRRTPEAAPSLEPSPVERHRENLAARADDRRGPQVPHVKHDRPASHERPREPRERTAAHDRPMDQRTRRQVIPQQAVGLPLREEERKVLAEVDASVSSLPAILPRQSMTTGAPAWSATWPFCAKRDWSRSIP